MAVIGVPMAAVALIFGNSIMAVIYTEQYSSTGLVFGVLVLASVVRNLSVPFASICMATGRTHPLRWTVGIRLLMVAAGMYPSVRFYGVIGAAECVLVAVVASFVIQILVLKRLRAVSATGMAAALFPAVSIGLVVLLLSPFGLRLTGAGPKTVWAASSALVSVVAYVIVRGRMWRVGNAHNR